VRNAYGLWRDACWRRARLLNHGGEGVRRRRSRGRPRGCRRAVGAAARVRPLELYPVLHLAVVLAVIGVVVAVRLVGGELPRRLLLRQLPDDVFWLHGKHANPVSFLSRSRTTKKKRQREEEETKTVSTVTSLAASSASSAATGGEVSLLLAGTTGAPPPDGPPLFLLSSLTSSISCLLLWFI
jgi:hypothetical protein